MKNENGSGSVYKLKGKRKKCWIARVTIGFEGGKQKRKVIGTYETRKEAQTELLGYLNNPTLYSGKTFKDVKDLWYSNYSKTVSNVTLRNVNNQLKKLEVFNDVKIKDLKLYTLQKFFDDLDGAYGSKLYLRSALNMIFEFALKNEFIETNRIKFIELGKNEKIVERRIFTTDEINVLFDSLDSDKKCLMQL